MFTGLKKNIKLAIVLAAIVFLAVYSVASINNFWEIIICIGALLFVAIMAKAKSGKNLDKDRNFKYSESGVYGTASLLTEEEMKDVALVQPRNEMMGTILGQMDNPVQECSRLFGLKTYTKQIKSERIINTLKASRQNKHVAVFGASQSGKTYCYAKPFCLQAVRRRESLIVTDPKGELYEDTSQYFRDNGYLVRRFDLKTLELADGWDCLREIKQAGNVQDMELRAQIFAHTVMQNLGEGQNNDVFSSCATSLLKALLLRVALDDEFVDMSTGELRQNMGGVYSLLQSPLGEDFLNSVFDEAKMPEKARPCLGPYQAYKQGSPNLRGSVISGLAARLNILQSETVKKILSTDDIDLSLPGQIPCVYYCITSDQHSTMNFISALFFSFLFIDLVDYADSLPNRKCKVAVNFLLDEFANIGSIPDFDKKMATIRSRDLNVSIILQDINQLKNRYPFTWSSILSNCATHLCIGFNDPETQKYYSDRAGQTTVKVKTEQHEAYESIFKRKRKNSTGDGRRALLSQDELARFGPNDCLIVFQNHNAMKAFKFPYDSHPEAKLMMKKKVHISDYPSINDEAARAALREAEAKKIKEYNEWLANGGDPFPYLKYNPDGSPKQKEFKVSPKALGKRMSKVFPQPAQSRSDTNNVADEEYVFEIDDAICITTDEIQIKPSSEHQQEETVQLDESIGTKSHEDALVFDKDVAPLDNITKFKEVPEKRVQECEDKSPPAPAEKPMPSDTNGQTTQASNANSNKGQQQKKKTIEMTTDLPRGKPLKGKKPTE